MAKYENNFWINIKVLDRDRKEQSVPNVDIIILRGKRKLNVKTNKTGIVGFWIDTYPFTITIKRRGYELYERLVKETEWTNPKMDMQFAILKRKEK